MSRNKIQHNSKLIIAAFLLLCCFIGFGIFWHNKQTKTQLIYTQLPMMQGKDIRRASVGLNEMNDICSKRILQEARECDRLHISRSERHRRIFAVVNSGNAEVNRVVASGYTKTFDPNVMDKAAQAAASNK